jgi:hypothetical protein
MKPLTEIYADSARGIYIPQFFAETFDREAWKHIDPDDIDILRQGPDHSEYWGAWESVLDNAETVGGAILYQDGDLFVVNLDKARDELQSVIDGRVEYETEHRDAGDNYAHLPAESWTNTDTDRLMDELRDREIDTRGIDPETVAEMALDLFEMETDHMFSMFGKTRGIMIACYPIQEIEIDLREMIESDLAYDLAKDGVDAYVRHDGFAYVTTDCAWSAVVDPEKLKQAIADYVEERA